MGAIDRLRSRAVGFPAAAILCLLAILYAVPVRAELTIPTLTGRVVDQAGVLDAATEAAITRQLADYEAATTNQVVVVTLSGLQGYPIEDWGLAMLRGWGIGQKDKNNGVVLVVAPNDRQLRIEVGYGLEGELPDATANTIIQSEIIPRFKAGSLPGGITAGVNAILSALGGSYKPSLLAQPVRQSGSAFFIFLAQSGPVLFFGLMILVVIVTHVRRKWNPRRRKNVWYWRRDRGGYSGSSSSGFSSGGFSSGGFSSGGGGGGFSGGGGSGGGGGASGHW